MNPGSGGSHAVESVPVGKWHWLNLVNSEHGPTSDLERHLVNVLALLMTERRVRVHPSQTYLAKRVRRSDRQVRRGLDSLESAGWVQIEAGRAGGQGWRLNVYSPRVPAALKVHLLSRYDESTAEGADEAMSARPAEGADAVVSARSPDIRTSETRGADTFGPTRGHFGAKERTSGCPTKSYEVLKSLEGSKLPPTVKDGSPTESRTESTNSRIANPGNGPKITQNADQLAQTVRNAIKRWPTYSPAEISRLTGADVETVEAVRNGVLQ